MSAPRLSLIARLFTVAIAVSLLSACGGGTPTEEKETFGCPYRLPWNNTLGEITVKQGYAEPGNRSHIDDSGMEYAIDFALPEGTAVLVARGGLVSKIHDGETAYGGEEFKNNANFVIIGHADGTFSLYTHLQRTVFTKADEGTRRVQQGEVIGYSGKTGWTNGRPHLHYQLQERGDRFGQSIPLCFEEVEGGVPLLNQAYTSRNQMVMVQGIQVTSKAEQLDTFPWDEGLLGLWRGEVETNVDGNWQKETITVEITTDCPTGDICLYFPGSLEPGPYPHDQPGDYLFCFGDGYNYYCFGLKYPSTDTLFYQGHGPLWVSNGELQRVSSTQEGEIEMPLPGMELLPGEWEGKLDSPIMFRGISSTEIHAEIAPLPHTTRWESWTATIRVGNADPETLIHVGAYRFNNEPWIICFLRRNAPNSEPREFCFRRSSEDTLEFFGGQPTGIVEGILYKIK